MVGAVDLLFKLRLWIYLFCCCFIQFNNDKVMGLEEFTLCANLSSSTTKFHLSIGNDVCLLKYYMNSTGVYVEIGENVDKTETIITKNGLMDFCFIWNGSEGKYLISSSNGNVNLPQQRTRCCENFTLSHHSTTDKGNCSYLKGFNLTHIQFVNSSHVVFSGFNCSRSESTTRMCEKKTKALMEAASLGNTAGATLTIPFNVAVFSTLFVDRILADCGPSIPGRQILYLESLLRNVYFTDQPLKTILTQNVKVVLIGTGYNDFTGAHVTSNSSWITTNRTIEVINPTVEITVPKEVRKGLFSVFNVVLAVYKVPTQLQNQKRNILNDDLIGITVGKHSVDLNNNVTITLAHTKKPENLTECVFLDFASNDFAGASHWNVSGCTTKTNGNQTICSCNHLTFFAVLLDLNRDGNNDQDPKSEANLEYITLIGLVISIFFLVISMIYYMFSRKETVKDFSIKIHINLCISMLLLNMNFLLNVWLLQLDISTLCVVLAMSLHYFILSLFGWMGIEGFHLYLMIVKVFNTNIKWYLPKICLIAWGAPALIVCISYGANQETYGNYTIGNNSTFCWVTNDIVYYVTNVGIFSVVFLGNTTMVIIVSMKIVAMKRAERTHNSQRSSWKSVFSVLSLNCLLGLTYGLGFLTLGSQRRAVLYLFTVFNSLQGFFLFLRQIVLIAFARKENVKSSSSS
ncbi:adhesion G protein-coupled receptor G3-like isoform X2 [Scyliorhinus torazame]|uniref:adhesion G protein-coupled receptor G3-like isoform X2 n=1 Tax=Scyliorhinus torazame TaxID=75743 RepID=UPI003B5A9E58